MSEVDRPTRPHSPAVAAVISAFLGGAAFGWGAGLRPLDPREFGWVMQGDWRIHFLGWHLFRNEPWQFIRESVALTRN